MSLDSYVAVERRELLRDTITEALWISTRGGPLSLPGMNFRLRTLSLERFGVAFGAQRFRASLTTTQALESPETPLDAAAILGHSPEVSLLHYNQATAVRAAKRHADNLRELRKPGYAGELPPLLRIGR